MDFQSRYDRNEFLKFLRNDFLWEKFEEHVEQTSITKEFKSIFFTSITKLWVVEEFDDLIVILPWDKDQFLFLWGELRQL